MLTENPRSIFSERKKWAELLFETFKVPSMCVGNTAPLSLFASGRTTGVVVECGAGLTSTVPVFEGLALTHASITTEYGGQDISLNLKNTLLGRNIQIDLFDSRILKERMCFVVSTPVVSHHLSNSNSPEDSRVMSLPDGTEVKIENSIFSSCVEPLCSGRDLDNPARTISSWGLVEQTFQTIKLCDDSARRDLCQNVILSGGTSMLPGQMKFKISC